MLNAILNISKTPFLTGLPLDGNPVCGDASLVSTLVHDLLGGHEHLEKGSYIKLKWLLRNFQTVPQECPDIDPYARAYLLFLIGCVILPGVSRYMVPGELLLMLEDISAIDTFAWGSALFAHLHNALECIKQSRGNSKGRNLSASTLILEIFALEHLPEVASKYFTNRSQEFSLPGTIPLVGAWSNLLAPYCKDGFNRLQLDAVTEISWRPYDRIRVIDPMLLHHYIICSGVFYTICLERIFLYNYENCVKQLGLPSLPIPNKIKKIKSKSRRGEPKDWRNVYKAAIEAWHVKEDTFVSGLDLPELVIEEVGASSTPEPNFSPFPRAANQPLVYQRRGHREKHIPLRLAECKGSSAIRGLHRRRD